MKLGLGLTKCDLCRALSIFSLPWQASPAAWLLPHPYRLWLYTFSRRSLKVEVIFRAYKYGVCARGGGPSSIIRGVYI